MTRGLARSSREKIDPEAITDLTQAIEADPGSQRAWYHRAGIYLSLQDYERAISDLDHLVELAPTYSLAYRDRGRAYFLRGLYPDAQRDYDKAIQLAPGDAKAWLYRSDVREKLDDPRGELQDLDEALRRARGSEQWTPEFQAARTKLETLRSRQ